MRPATFVSPNKEAFSFALDSQKRVLEAKRLLSFCTFLLHSFFFVLSTNFLGAVVDAPFKCHFYELPVAEYISDDLPLDIVDLEGPDITVHSGSLQVDLKSDPIGKGRFKTAHYGRVTLDPIHELEPFTNKTVCVKQLYRERSNGSIARVPGREELGAFLVECNSLRWASILLDMTYQFIEDEMERRGKPDLKYPIPELRFVRAMVAIVMGSSPSDQKVFFVEEWIENSDGDEPDLLQFRKYVNNRIHSSCLPLSASAREESIAYFLLFSQHVQWQKSKMEAFVSDYQGAGRLLTDPQITTNP